MPRPTRFIAVALAATILAAGIGGCRRDGDGRSPAATRQDGRTLAAARAGFRTSFHDTRPPGDAPEPPPSDLARLVRYPSPAGDLTAYLTTVPQDGPQHPAIIWITGGDSNTIDASVFERQSPENDQSARQYREAGIVTMYPSLRGGNANPGHREGLFGEVDDVLAAAAFLARQPGIDPQRIYLGGHSVGGTLVMLVAEASPRFRAAFAFGPVTDPALHQRDNVPLDPDNAAEMALRRPIDWLGSVRSPLFVLEGADGLTSNIDQLRLFQRASGNPRIHFVPIAGADHFSGLAAANRVIAAKIIADTGTTTNLSLVAGDIGRN